MKISKWHASKTIEIVHAALIWITMFAAEKIAAFALRHTPSSIGYYFVAIGLASILCLMIPLLGRKEIVQDIQEICLIDIFVQIFGLVCYQIEFSLTAYMIMAQMVSLLKMLRLVWPILGPRMNLPATWPTFGLLGYLRNTYGADTAQTLFQKDRKRMYLVMMATAPIGFIVQQGWVWAGLPIPDFIIIIFSIGFTNTIVVNLETLERNHAKTQHELGVAEGVAAARAEMILELTAKNEKIEQQSIELAATNRQLEELAADLSRKNAELEAMALQQAALAQDLSKRNESLRDANHDVKQPITKLRFYTDRARTFATDETQTKFLHLVEAGLEEVSSMMHSIINQAKISTQLVAPSIQDIKVEDLINYFQESFFEMAGERGSFFGQKEAKCIIRSNEILLKRIISNLLHNAILHTPPGTLVYLSFQRNARECCIRVWDRGPGIVNANGPDRAYNFTSFIAQLKEDDSLDVDSNSPVGHGLGLTSVQRICEELGVTMTLKSIPGIGTVFRFCVPLAMENNK